MKFALHKVSDWGFCSEIEIRNLDELLEFVTREGEIILSPIEQPQEPCWNSRKKKIHEEKFDIRIYDGFNE